VIRSVRSVLLCLAVAAALGAAGCGNKQDSTNVGHTEGIYVTVDDLKYQVQISRILNPADREDRAYLLGLPAGQQPAKDEVWFAIFMRVENDTNKQLSAASEFKIVDTQGSEFQPVPIDTAANVFSYAPRPIPPGELLPQVGTAAYDNTIQGSLILFKVKTGSLYNRPLELEILGNDGHDARVDLDV
jgi:hypothetical protein